MTGLEALKALAEGKIIQDSGGRLVKIEKAEALIDSLGNNKNWSELGESWTIQSIVRDTDRWTLYRPKPELPKYFQCWAVRKNDPKIYGPIHRQSDGTTYVGGGFAMKSKVLFELYFVYDRNGKPIEEEK